MTRNYHLGRSLQNQKQKTNNQFKDCPPIYDHGTIKRTTPAQWRVFRSNHSCLSTFLHLLYPLIFGGASDHFPSFSVICLRFPSFFFFPPFSTLIGIPVSSFVYAHSLVFGKFVLTDQNNISYGIQPLEGCRHHASSLIKQTR